MINGYVNLPDSLAKIIGEGYVNPKSYDYNNAYSEIKKIVSLNKPALCTLELSVGGVQGRSILSFLGSDFKTGELTTVTLASVVVDPLSQSLSILTVGTNDAQPNSVVITLTEVF